VLVGVAAWGGFLRVLRFVEVVEAVEAVGWMWVVGVV
jgi:hypothetical protein